MCPPAHALKLAGIAQPARDSLVNTAGHYNEGCQTATARGTISKSVDCNCYSYINERRNRLSLPLYSLTHPGAQISGGR